MCVCVCVYVIVFVCVCLSLSVRKNQSSTHCFSQLAARPGSSPLGHLGLRFGFMLERERKKKMEGTLENARGMLRFVSACEISRFQ